MATKTISFTLDSKSMANAMNAFRQFKQDFAAKCVQVRKLVAERIRWSAEEGFRTAIADDVFGKIEDRKIVPAPLPPNDVTVTVQHGDEVSVVIAEGEQAVFIEYGAGVYHNGSPGDSPHPWGIQQGYGIGTYGQGKGVRNTWGYKKNGEVFLTHGTPAAIPMYRGAEEAIRAIGEIISEVFGT